MERRIANLERSGGIFGARPGAGTSSDPRQTWQTWQTLADLWFSQVCQRKMAFMAFLRTLADLAYLSPAPKGKLFFLHHVQSSRRGITLSTETERGVGLPGLPRPRYHAFTARSHWQTSSRSRYAKVCQVCLDRDQLAVADALARVVGGCGGAALLDLHSGATGVHPAAWRLLATGRVPHAVYGRPGRQQEPPWPTGPPCGPLLQPSRHWETQAPVGGTRRYTLPCEGVYDEQIACLGGFGSGAVGLATPPPAA